MRRTLATLPALPLALGVLAGVMLPSAESLLEYVIPAAAMAVGIYIIATLRGYSAVYFFTGLITAVFSWYLHRPTKAPDTIFDGHTHNFALLVETVREGPVGSRLTAEVLQADGQEFSSLKCCLTLSDNAAMFDPGDVVSVSAVAERADALAAIPTAASAVRAAKADGIALNLLVKSASVNKIGQIDGLRVRLLRSRRVLADAVYSSPLPPETAALLVAGCLGTGDAPAAVKERFTATGLSHLLCVSGFHVAVVAWIISLFLWPMRVWTHVGRMRYGLLIIIIWCYVCFVGCAPSAIRAAVMLTTFYLARLLQRPVSPYNSLALAVVVMLLIEPFWLYSAGFQLSVSAVIGLLLFADKLNPVPMHYHCLYRVVSLVAVPLAAMIGTLPAMLLWFHRLPLLSVPVNTLASLVFVPLMILGFAAVVLYWLGFSILWLNPLLRLLTDTIYGLCDKAMEISWHRSGGVLLSDTALVCVVAAVICLALLLYVRKPARKICAAVSIAACTGYALLIPGVAHEDEAFVYGNYRNTELYVFRGDSVSVSIGRGNRPALHAMDDYIELRVSEPVGGTYDRHDSAVALVGRNIPELSGRSKVLVIDGSYRGNVAELLEVAQPQRVLIGMNSKDALRDSIFSVCRRRGVGCELLNDGVVRLKLLDIDADATKAGTKI